MSKTIYIDPSYSNYLGNRLFDLDDKLLNRDNSLAPYFRMRAALETAKVRVVTADFLYDKDFLPGKPNQGYYYSLGMLENFEKIFQFNSAKLKAFVILEPPMVAPHIYAMLPRLTELFEEVYVHNVNGDGYSLSNVTSGSLKKLYWPLPYRGVIDQYWSRRSRQKKAVVINGNHKAWRKPRELYSERIRAMVELGKLDCIDLFGMDWNKWWSRKSFWPAYFLNLRILRKIYRGSCVSKYDVMANYDFSICIENMQMDGYITEKIFDCLYAGVIPLYFGAPDITQYVPKQCFLDRRDFNSWSDMWNYAAGMSDQEKQNIRESGRDFLSSKDFGKFYDSIENIFSQECA